MEQSNEGTVSVAAYQALLRFASDENLQVRYALQQTQQQLEQARAEVKMLREQIRVADRLERAENGEAENGEGPIIERLPQYARQR